MRKGLNKKKVIQWKLKQWLQDRLPHPEAEPKGAGLLPHPIPPDAFQIILERIDGFREVQNQHTEKMTAMQDQLDVLSAKFDSIYTNQEH